MEIFDCCVQGQGYSERSKFQLMFVWTIFSDSDLHYLGIQHEGCFTIASFLSAGEQVVCVDTAAGLTHYSGQSLFSPPYLADSWNERAEEPRQDKKTATIVNNKEPSPLCTSKAAYAPASLLYGLG